MTVLKRQRELKKSEKAARKRAKRLGRTEDAPLEPQPTIRLSDLLNPQPEEDDTDDESDDDELGH